MIPPDGARSLSTTLVILPNLLASLDRNRHVGDEANNTVDGTVLEYIAHMNSLQYRYVDD
jgi:hypothetical protein